MDSTRGGNALDRALDDNWKAAQDAAVQVLKACGMYGLEQPAGYTKAEDFEVAEQEQNGLRCRRLMFAAL